MQIKIPFTDAYIKILSSTPIREPQEQRHIEVADASNTYRTLEDYSGVELRHSWCLACVRAIATAVSTVPLMVQKKNKDGWERVGREKWEVAALEDVNGYQSQQDLLEATASFLGLQGEYFWEKTRNKAGKLTKLYGMNPVYVRVQPGGEYISQYVFDLPGQKPVPFDPQDVIFFKFFNPVNDYRGMSPLSAAREGVLSDLYAQQYNKNFFKNNATPRGVLETDKGLSNRALKRVKDLWQTVYGGIENAHKTAVLEEGLKYKALSISPKDMEFLKLREFSREEILAVFGVYPVVLGLLKDASLANAMAQMTLFYQSTVSLYLNKIQSQLTYHMQVEMKDPTIRVMFDLTQVPALRPSVGDVLAWATPAVNSGIMLINEVRDILGLKHVAWGDTWYANSAMIPMADENGPIGPAAGEPSYAAGFEQALANRKKIIESTNSDIAALSKANAELLRKISGSLQ
jgi:HK97 family phage portal protein